MTPETDVEPRDVLAALERELIDGDHPVATAPDVAERLPIGRRQTHQKLQALELTEKVASRKVGSGRAWYCPHLVEVTPPAEPLAEPLGERPPSVSATEHLMNRDGESGDSSPSAEPPAEPAADPSSDPSEEPGAEPAADDGRDEAIEAVDIPGKEGTVVEDRREALRAVLAYLDENGTTRAGQLQDELFGEYPAGYKTDYSWWNNFMKPALSNLESEGYVELVHKQQGKWNTP